MASNGKRSGLTEARSSLTQLQIMADALEIDCSDFSTDAEVQTELEGIKATLHRIGTALEAEESELGHRRQRRRGILSDVRARLNTARSRLAARRQTPEKSL